MATGSHVFTSNKGTNRKGLQTIDKIARHRQINCSARLRFKCPDKSYATRNAAVRSAGKHLVLDPRYSFDCLPHCSHRNHLYLSTTPPITIKSETNLFSCLFSRTSKPYNTRVLVVPAITVLLFHHCLSSVFSSGS